MPCALRKADGFSLSVNRDIEALPYVYMQSVLFKVQSVPNFGKEEKVWITMM
jgi:hypothetical protein